MYQNTEYGYLPLSEDQTTTLVSSYKTEIGARADIVDESLVEEIPEETVTVIKEIEYLYDYNSLRNITRVRKVENGVTSTLYSYVYDEAEQIVRENNFELGKTYVYVYDIGGNIVQKIEYAVTEETLGTPLSTTNYGYDNVWKDKLVSYNGTTITSDAMGNPLNAVSLNAIGGLENLELEWNGRQLSAVTRNTQRFEYSYDSNGMRTEIREYDRNGELETVCHYAWQNGKLVGLDIRDGSGEVRFVVKMIYDNAGESTGYIITDEENSKQDVMHFQKNLQGDITGVFCESYGREVLTYKYDAWGNISPQIIGTSGTMLYWSDIALLLTPITYRGYMYDPYIGMYYLQSRYYNPAYGRFLNVDDTDILEASQGTTHGANLFAYCNNNPVMNVDCTGESSLLFAFVGGLSTFIPFAIALIGILIILVIYYLNPNLYSDLAGNIDVNTTLNNYKTLVVINAFQLVDVNFRSLMKDISERISDYKFRNGKQKHHIAPRKVFFYKGTTNEIYCSMYLELAGIHIDSPINTIWLNASFHSALNTNMYYSYVYNITKTSYESMKSVGVFLSLVLLQATLGTFNYIYVMFSGGSV